MELIKVFRKSGCTLRLWDTFQTDSLGKSRLRYQLKSGQAVMFEGDDFSCSPLHAIDSLDTVAALLSFLTLQPGDTDREYFDSYTPDQLDWCHSTQAEALRMWQFDYEERQSRRNRRK